MAKNVIGVYESEQEVVQAVESLKMEGYTPEDISLVANSENASWLQSRTDASVESSGSAGSGDDKSFWEKAKDVFLDNDTNNNSNGYFDRLTNLGLSESEAHEYDADVRSGKIVVLAPENGTGLGTQGGTRQTDYGNNLSASDPVRKEDTTNDTNSLTGATKPNQRNSFENGLGSRTNETEDEKKLRLREERLDVDKENVKTGEVEVKKEVHEETQRIDVPVTREEVYVEKKPVDGKSANVDANGKIKDETIRVPIKEEKVEVRKKPVVTDEVEVGKRKVEETEQVTDNVKKEELHVDREGEKENRNEFTKGRNSAGLFNAKNRDRESDNLFDDESRDSRF